MFLEVLHERAVGFGELGVIWEGGGQPCRTETLGHGWYTIAVAIGLMLYYNSLAIVDRFVYLKSGSMIKMEIFNTKKVAIRCIAIV